IQIQSGKLRSGRAKEGGLSDLLLRMRALQLVLQMHRLLGRVREGRPFLQLRIYAQALLRQKIRGLLEQNHRDCEIPDRHPCVVPVPHTPDYLSDHRPDLFLHRPCARNSPFPYFFLLLFLENCGQKTGRERGGTVMTTMIPKMFVMNYYVYLNAIVLSHYTM